jgi:pilus assembly protein Flp/PilA
MHARTWRGYATFMTTPHDLRSSFMGVLRDDRGQGIVEYALVIALVSLVAISALKFLGAKASNTLNNAANAV